MTHLENHEKLLLSTVGANYRQNTRTHWMIIYQIVLFLILILNLLLWNIFKKNWQDSWDLQIHNKLHEIHSLVFKTPCSYGLTRKEQVILTRCRIWHSRLTHSYLLYNEEPPECITCNSNYTLKHVLIDYVDVAEVRRTFYILL